MVVPLIFKMCVIVSFALTSEKDWHLHPHSPKEPENSLNASSSPGAHVPDLVPYQKQSCVEHRLKPLLPKATV